MWNEGRGEGAKRVGRVLEDCIWQREPVPSYPFAAQVNDHIINNTVAQTAQPSAGSP